MLSDLLSFFFLGFFPLSLVCSMVEIFTKCLTLYMKSFNGHKIVFYPTEGLLHPLIIRLASLVAQLVKNPPAIRETWV